MVDELLLFVSLDTLAKEDIIVIRFKEKSSPVLRCHFSPVKVQLILLGNLELGRY